MSVVPPADRRAFLRAGAQAAGAAAIGACSDSAPRAATAPATMSTNTRRMPVLFVGHGSPMNAIEDNRWSRAFRQLARDLPQPTAVLAISAHWCTRGSWVTGEAQPRTIHDFSGFPPELEAMQYPAPGHRDLAQQVVRLLSGAGAGLRTDWGLDHGAWSVLARMYPDASVPCIQLSIDEQLSPAGMIELARSLAPLREQGVLLLGSGNITHNLRDAFARMQRGEAATPAWAREFDAAAAAALQAHDGARLADLVATPAGRQSHPHQDHWWPLLYAFAASDRDDAVAFPIEGFDLGSLSMRSVRFG